MSMPFLLLLLSLGFCRPAGAGQPPPQYISIAKVKAVTVGRAKKAEAVLVVKVQDGMHVQANPASNPRLIPTTLELAEKKGVLVGKIDYPAGQPYRLENTKEDLSVYTGKFELRVPLHAAPAAKKTRVSLMGTIRYQACNDKICFFPARLPVSIPVILNGK